MISSEPVSTYESGAIARDAGDAAGAGRLPSSADAIVVGGGVMGLLIARELAQRGLPRVVLLERRVVGAGSSGKSGAILRQHYSHPVTIRMARESLHWYRDFSERTGRPIGFRTTGMVFVARAEDADGLERNVALQRAAGVDVERLDTKGLRALAPAARIPDGAVGCIERDAAVVDPVRTVAAFAAEARAAGVELHEHAPVAEILRDGGAVTGVRVADQGVIRSPRVVNAGGPWAARVGATAGADLPIAAVRPRQAFLVDPNTEASDVTTDHVWLDSALGLYWKPEPGRLIRIGHMDFDRDPVVDPDHYDEGVDHTFLHTTRRLVSRRVPALSDAVSFGGCGALYAVTPDARGIVGPDPDVDGLFVAAGFSGHGFKLAPAIAVGLAGSIAGGPTGAFDPALFSPARFAAASGAATEAAAGAAAGEGAEASGASAYRYGILG